MSGQPAGLVHVVGRARTADRVTTTARALHHVLVRGGRPGRVMACHRDAGCEDFGELTALADSEVVLLHTVDGGEDLAPALPSIADRPTIVLHHGSAPGSDRHVLRTLRRGTPRAWAADPSAREELRALGFGSVARLDPAMLDGALDGVAPDQVSVDNLAAHPGPLVLSIGSFEPNQSMEILLRAFAMLVTDHRPSATLSVCGPAPRWYLATLRRHILAAGLLSCELLSPATDEQVVARLGRAAAVVALDPVGLDPFLHDAARRGLAVVAPLVAATAGLPTERLVPVSPRPRAEDVATALAAATEPTRMRTIAPPVDPYRLGRDLVGALGLRT